MERKEKEKSEVGRLDSWGPRELGFLPQLPPCFQQQLLHHTFWPLSRAAPTPWVSRALPWAVPKVGTYLPAACSRLLPKPLAIFRLLGLNPCSSVICAAKISGVYDQLYF